MGGCATKPKVLKSDEAEAPAPVPKPVAKVEEEVVVEEGDQKKKEGDGGVVQEDGKVDEIVVEDDMVDAAADDDLQSKPRSLSNLFKSEEERDSTMFEEAASKPVNEEETKETVKPKEESEAKPAEVEEQIEQQPSSLTKETFVDAPEKAITEKAAEATPTAETEIKESPEKKIEEAK